MGNPASKGEGGFIMKSWKGVAITLFLLTGFSVSLFAKGPGTVSAPFLTIGFGSRAHSLGNAFTALANDASSTYFNPAGLARSLSGVTAYNDIHASRTSWFQGIGINQFAVARFVPGGTSWGFAMTNLGVSDLEYRSGETERPDGYFKAEDNSFSLSAARQIRHSPLSMGVTVKMIQQRIASVSGDAMALDAGSQYRFKALQQNFSIGGGIRNVGSKLQLGSEAYPLPRSYHLGFAYQGLVNQVVEVSYSDTGRTQVSFGTEYWFLGVFGLRGGYLQNANRTDSANRVAGLSLKPGLTGGFGFKVVNTFGLDYAFVPFGDLGYAQRLTMTYKF